MSVTAFLTDSTLCIGCKACEVACKEWNQISDDGFNWSGQSYDNTGSLGHSSWRHVKFIENGVVPGLGGNSPDFNSWVFSSDVCKHCENAGCLEACPTGAIVRTEFGGVYIQPDICNGCAYCVVACPFGVVERNPNDGRAFKCTFCYDRQKAGLQPACATACPTESIRFGPLEDMRESARGRIAALKSRGFKNVHLYDPVNSSVGGLHALFIVRGDPENYNLPEAPEIPAVHLQKGWKSAGVAAGLMFAGALLAFFGSGHR
jgi:formate dehydrogenase iron-sulfur subunit